MVGGGEVKYHVHVYEVTRKYEVDLEGKDEVEVRLKAIELYNNKRAKLKEVGLDCKVIVLAFDKGEEDEVGSV